MTENKLLDLQFIKKYPRLQILNIKILNIRAYQMIFIFDWSDCFFYNLDKFFCLDI